MVDVVEVLDRIFDSTAVARDLEDQNVDFKTQGRSVPDTLDNLAEAAACFANADGGTVIVGVKDDGCGPEAFVGHSLDPVKTRLRIYEITNPALMVDVDAIRHRDRDVLIIRVPRGVVVHSVKSKLPTERVGDSCWPMDSRRIASVMADRSGHDWSAEPTNIPPSRADSAALSAARDLVRTSADPGRRRLDRLSDLDLLRALGVVGQRSFLTNAGALLFVGPLSGPAFSTYSHRRTPAGRLTANEVLDGPLILVIRRLFELIENRLETTSVLIGGGQQLHVADLPEAAVREAIVNATMHRDYRIGDLVAVEHTQTQLVVTSPGSFVTGVTTDNVLTTSSRSRNPQLAGALRMLDLAETAGSGVDRMYAEMTRLGHQPPRFTADNHSVRVSLLGGAPNTALTKFTASLPMDEGEDADTTTILLTMLTKRLIRADDLVPLLQKQTKAEAQSVLARLSSDGIALLEPTRDTVRHVYPDYRLREAPLTALGTAVTYRRRTTDQTDRKVIEVVRETGSVNARMIKILFDLPTPAVSRLLADLVDRKILVKLPGATRGPSVSYGPGAEFRRVQARRKQATPKD